MIVANWLFWLSKFAYLNKNDIILKSFNVSKDCKFKHDILICRGVYIYDDVSIGAYSYINKNSNIENCSIGNYCSISSNVFVSPAEHDYKNISTSPHLTIRKIERKKTYIGDNVLIGCQSVIKAGVKVGTGAVIGAGSIVTHDVPDYAVVAGNPAKVIKYRFNSDIINLLNTINWNLSPEELKKQIKILNLR